MNNTLSENIELFFEDPSKEPRPRPTFYGVLYLLRRDIATCLPNVAEWPGIMTIMAGIDLLGKFHAGNDNHRNVGNRFISFLSYFDNITENEKKVIYQLRNSLLHSFGLYSVDREGNVYRFTLSTVYPQLVRQDGEDCYISVLDLRDNFELSVKNYYKELINNEELQSKFGMMFPKYGSIYMT